MTELHTPEITRANGAILAKYAGGILKADGSTFNGYGIRWHAPNRPDLQGEWFSAKTYLMRNAGYPVSGIPVNYQHGMKSNFGNLAIGIVRFANEDDIGLFIEGELKTREEYIQMLREIGRKTDVAFTDSQLAQKSVLMTKAVEELITSVPLQFSGGFDPSTWVVDENTRHIEQAGMIHLAFTPTPADDLNPMVSFKSAMEEILHVPSRHIIPGIQTGKPETSKDAQHTATASRPSDVEHSSHTDTQGKKNMTLEEIMALLRQLEDAMVAYGQESGTPAADAGEMAQEVETEMAAMPEEEMKAITAQQIAEKAFALFEAKVNARKQAAKSAQDAFTALVNQRKAQQPARPATGAYTNPANNPLVNQDVTKGNRSGAADVQVFSKFHKWDARDFSFALNIHSLQRQSGKRLMKSEITQEFAREFADKALKGYQAGTLHMDEPTFKSVMRIKSDELDYSTQDAYGDELVPTIWSQDIWERPRQDNVIQNIFQSVEMPSNPYEYPVESTDPTVYFVAETKHEAQLSLDSTTRPIPSSKVGTNKVTFSAKKFGLQVQWSSELEEDAIARLVPQFRAQAERAMQDKGIDNVALNGDTSTTGNINSDGETITATTRNYLAYDGLIHQPLVTATSNRLDASGANPTISHLRAVRALLGTPEGYSPQNLAWIMDFATYMKLLSDDTVLTVDKYGNQATVLTGELGKIDGIPVFVSAEMALADADGKVTQTSNTVNRGRAILVHRPSWLLGFRRQIQQSLDFIPFFDTWILTITTRNHFLPRTATDGTLQSTDDSTAILYNIGV